MIWVISNDLSAIYNSNPDVRYLIRLDARDNGLDGVNTLAWNVSHAYNRCPCSYHFDKCFDIVFQNYVIHYHRLCQAYYNFLIINNLKDCTKFTHLDVSSYCTAVIC